jgi:hypothetical protein
LTTKRTKHQRELYELAGEFFELRSAAIDFHELATTTQNEGLRLIGVRLKAYDGGHEAIKLAESGE